MAERPILFNGEMVRSILSGAKTMTRRPIKPQPDGQPVLCSDGKWCVDGGLWLGSAPAAVGDVLWVRETWQMNHVNHLDGKIPKERPAGLEVMYLADGTPREQCPEDYEGDWWWRPSIHMPKWASRIRLVVTDVRAERLLDVTEADTVAEGLTVLDAIRRKVPTVRDAFSLLWDDLYADTLPWSSNPFVWAVTFKREVV